MTKITKDSPSQKRYNANMRVYGQIFTVVFYTFLGVLLAYFFGKAAVLLGLVVGVILVAINSLAESINDRKNLDHFFARALVRAMKINNEDLANAIVTEDNLERHLTIGQYNSFRESMARALNLKVTYDSDTISDVDTLARLTALYFRNGELAENVKAKLSDDAKSNDGF